MRFLGKNSVVTKIVATAAILAAIFLSIPITLIILNVEDSLIDTKFNLLQTQTEAQVSNIDVRIREINETILFLSQTPPIQGMFRAQKNDGFDIEQNSTIEQWVGRLTTIMQAEVDVNSDFLQLRYIDENGDEIIRVNRNKDIVSVVPAEQLQNKGDRPYFNLAKVLQIGEVYISPVELNREGNPPQIQKPFESVIRYATPVFDLDSGEQKGIIIGNISYENIIDQSQLSHLEDSEMYIIDQDGYFQTASDENLLWGSPDNLNTGILAKDFIVGFSDTIFDQETGVINADNFLLAHTRLDISNDISWIVIRETPLSAVIGDVKALGIEISLIAIVTFGVLFFVFLFSIKRLLHPLEKVKRLADQIRQGQFGKTIKISSDDEVGSLAKAINLMSVTLKDLYEDLEKKVEDRTRELSEQKSKIELLIQEMPFGVLVEDANRKITLVNNSFLKMFSLSENTKDVVTKPSDIIGADVNEQTKQAKNIFRNPDAFIKKTDDLVKGRKQSEGEKLYLIDGRVIERNYVPVVIEKEFKGSMWICNDVTEEDKISKMKSDFISLVSHQLKTPIAQIKGYIENMLDGLAGKVSTKQKNYLENMMKISDTNARLIDDMLNVSRVERGILKVEKEQINLVDLLDRALSTFNKKKEDKNITFDIEVLSDYAETEVIVDVNKSIQAIRNIVDNSIRYTTEGGTIKIGIEVKKKTITISITDNGPGIPPEIEKELFNKDKLLNKGSSNSYNTGLGLYLSFNFIKIQGGLLTYKTAQGKGTTFYIDLPYNQNNKK